MLKKKHARESILMDDDSEKTIHEQNLIIMDLLETIELCRTELRKSNELIEKLKESVIKADNGREYWVKKYYKLQDEIIQKEREK